MLRYSRIQFFLKEALLIQNLNKKNLIEFLQESYANQRKLLEIGSEQIDALIDVGKEYS